MIHTHDLTKRLKKKGWHDKHISAAQRHFAKKHDPKKEARLFWLIIFASSLSTFLVVFGVVFFLFLTTKYLIYMSLLLSGAVIGHLFSDHMKSHGISFIGFAGLFIFISSSSMLGAYLPYMVMASTLSKLNIYISYNITALSLAYLAGYTISFARSRWN